MLSPTDGARLRWSCSATSDGARHRIVRRATHKAAMTLLRLIATFSLILMAIAAGGMLRLAPQSSRVRGEVGRLLCRMACRTLGIRVTWQGDPPSERPALLLSNHVSWTDVLAFGSIAPVCFLARHDVATWPAIGVLARLFGTLFIERGRLRRIPAVNTEIAARMRAGELVGFFPEATTGDGTRLKPFHAAHVASARDLLRAEPRLGAVTLAPAAIVYARRRGLPLGRDQRARVAWYGDTEFAPHLLELVRDGGAECRITFLPPVSYDRTSDRKAVARELEAAIGAEMRRILAGSGGSESPASIHSLLQRV